MIVQLTLFDPIPIQLTRGCIAFVDPIDSDLLNHKWSVHASKWGFYAARRVKTQAIFLHRVILSRVLDRDLVQGELVDHIDGNPMNNLRSNLRLAGHSQNKSNSRLHKNNTSGYKGVYRYKSGRKWYVRIGVNGNNIYLGGFSDSITAAHVYDAAARKYFGEFAQCNFPEER